MHVTGELLQQGGLGKARLLHSYDYPPAGLKLATWLGRECMERSDPYLARLCITPSFILLLVVYYSMKLSRAIVYVQNEQ